MAPSSVGEGRPRRLAGRVAAAIAASAMLACGPQATVRRLYDGRSVDGRYIEPGAYAAFLRGAVADASGDRGGALAGYGAAAEEDPASVEIWARLGEVRCEQSTHDTAADRSFVRAIQLDPSLAAAWTARAQCQLSRGDGSGAEASARRAAALDPSADSANVLLANLTTAEAEAARQALVALTVTARDPALAWEAVATWARGRGDVALWVHALGELARVAPSKREAIARSAEELAGEGELAGARAVAAAAADAADEPLAGGHGRLAARLAVDDAIARYDEGAVRLRSTRVHLGLDEAAGRALLAGARSLAVRLASSSAGADPSARGARLVLAAARADGVGAAAADLRAGDSPASAAAFVAYGVALLHVMTGPTARSALDAIAHDALLGGDDRVLRPAVELAWRGAIAPETLPPEGRVELAALLDRLPADPRWAGPGVSLDARHAYLALALTSPLSASARQLAVRLGASARGDPVVASASALMNLAAGTIDAGESRPLRARDPGDLLLAATALRLAKRAGDREGARAAREALAAFAGPHDANGTSRDVGP